MKCVSKFLLSVLVVTLLSGALGASSEVAEQEAATAVQQPTKQSWLARWVNKRPFKAAKSAEMKVAPVLSESSKLEAVVVPVNTKKELSPEAQEKLTKLLNEEVAKTPQKNWVHYTKITFKYLYKLVVFLLKAAWLGLAFGTAVLKFVLLFMLVLRGSFVPVMFSIAL